MSGAAGEEELLTPTLIVDGVRYTAPKQDVHIYHIKDKYVGLPIAAVLAQMFARNMGQDPDYEQWQKTVYDHGKCALKRKKRSREEPVAFELVQREPTGEEPILPERGCQLRLESHLHQRCSVATDPSIIFEDERFLVVDKPCGLPSLGEVADCFASVLDWCNRYAKRMHQQQQQQISKTSTARPKKKGKPQGHANLSLVNRLDIDVSGVVVLAKGNHNRKLMMDKMVTRVGLKKLYVARVAGKLQGAWRIETAGLTFDRRQRKALVPSPDEVAIECAALEAQLCVAKTQLEALQLQATEANLEAAAAASTEISDLMQAVRAAKAQQQASRTVVEQLVNFSEYSAGTTCAEDQDVSDGGTHLKQAQQKKRRALTCVNAVGYHEGSDTTLVEITLGTGQRHQIRAHLSFIGHPIANDKTYGGVKFKASISKRLYPAEHREEIGAFFTKYKDPNCVRCAFAESVLAGENESGDGGSEGNERPGIYLSSGIWLHAWKYEIDEYSFVSDKPSWYITNDF